MELKDKKKIARWLYGNEVCAEGWLTDPRGAEYLNNRECTNFDDWNPDEDRNVWSEIWRKMNALERESYIMNLRKLSGVNTRNWDVCGYPVAVPERDFVLHTISPYICTKALLKVIDNA